MPASDKRLGDLHSKLTETLIEGVQERRIEEKEKDDEGNEVTRVRVVLPAPAVLAVAAKFLKDNSITADVATDEKMAELKKKLGNRAPSNRDMKDALGSLGSELIQ